MEQLDVVNAKNEVVGTASREKVYERKLTHRLVHVLILHPNGKEIFLQVRSPQKKDYPNLFSTSTCGHVHSKESYLVAAKRELQEELGIRTPLRPAFSFKTNYKGCKVFAECFFGYAETGFAFDPKEVLAGKFYPFPEAMEIAKSKDAHPQLKTCMKWLIANRERLPALWATTETIKSN